MPTEEEYADRLVEQYQEEHKKICWNCGAATPPINPDPPYGFICPACGLSHRTHPELGEGKSYDRIVPNNFSRYLLSRRSK